ncbi:DUF202 domain-containing protein [Pimelobacter simplex]|uniref:Putative integral membrane protein n=1 Tax=Nocardioides simplex TaxID=2045 RepID=A0A0A1DN44_NOCSI|nr:DUF202 domain-containing protein [Pimelobacter simplex]AIY18831.2 putative integral membrane protein [Pimelobacter simplex]MCG8152432.1 DUF202 domain-containing protein [Pimelobacter simplex]GEB14546.1 hypothetical protein NSI01_28610 [Pimelobacter simplex]SFM28403.1 putative membrane protein [Pimelobacter simplex]
MTAPRTGPANGGAVDYRVTLANERTFLAWTRTALAGAAASVAVTQLVDAGDPWVRTGLAVLLGLGALAGVMWALRRWRAVEIATRTGAPITTRGPWAVTAVTVAVACGAVVLALGAR